MGLLLSSCGSSGSHQQTLGAPATETSIVAVTRPEPINPIHDSMLLKVPPPGARTPLSPSAALQAVERDGIVDPSTFSSVTMKLGLLELQDMSVESSPGRLALKDRLVVVVTGQVDKCAASFGVTDDARVGKCWWSTVLDAATGEALMTYNDGPV